MCNLTDKEFFWWGEKHFHENIHERGLTEDNDMTMINMVGDYWKL